MRRLLAEAVRRRRRDRQFAVLAQDDEVAVRQQQRSLAEAALRPLQIAGLELQAHDAGAIAAHTRGTINYFEILNEPDGAWAFLGTPQQYAAMLRSSYDAIHAAGRAIQVDRYPSPTAAADAGIRTSVRGTTARFAGIPIVVAR